MSAERVRWEHIQPSTSCATAMSRRPRAGSTCTAARCSASWRNARRSTSSSGARAKLSVGCPRSASCRPRDASPGDVGTIEAEVTADARKDVVAGRLDLLAEFSRAGEKQRRLQRVHDRADRVLLRRGRLFDPRLRRRTRTIRHRHDRRAARSTGSCYRGRGHDQRRPDGERCGEHRRWRGARDARHIRLSWAASLFSGGLLGPAAPGPAPGAASASLSAGRSSLASRMGPPSSPCCLIDWCGDEIRDLGRGGCGGARRRWFAVGFRVERGHARAGSGGSGWLSVLEPGDQEARRSGSRRRPGAPSCGGTSRWSVASLFWLPSRWMCLI